MPEVEVELATPEVESHALMAAPARHPKNTSFYFIFQSLFILRERVQGVHAPVREREEGQGERESPAVSTLSVQSPGGGARAHQPMRS